MFTINDINLGEVAKTIAKQWGELTDEQVELLAKNIYVDGYKKNDVIYESQDYPRVMFCLIQGKVKICKDGLYGRSQILRVLKPYAFFGYRAHFAQEDYKTDGIALEDCQVAKIPNEITDQLIQENKDIAMFFINMLSILLGASDDRIISLTQKHLRGRLAESLISLKDKYGFREDGNTLDVSMSREDLANMSSMTTSNAIRTLSSFAQEDIIELCGKKIRFLNEKELEKISNLG